MELRHYLEFLKRRWRLLLIACLVAASAAFFVSQQLTPIYSANTTVLINQTTSAGMVQYNDILTSERLTSTYAKLVKRDPILVEVRRRLNLPLADGALDRKISVAPITNTQLLEITAEDASPQLAAKIANTTAQAFIDDNTGQLSNRPGTVSIIEPARIPGSPVKPNIKLNTALAAMLGLMIGGVLALGIEYLDDTVKTANQVDKVSGLTNLGSVSLFSRPRDSSKRDKAAAPTTRAAQGSAEDYRQIRTNIHFSLFGVKAPSILITSTNPGEGKSTTAANLAIVLAQAGHRVILVDADLRRPSLHLQFGTPNSFGLTGLLLTEADGIEKGLLKTNVPGLHLLPSGPLPPNPSEVLMSLEVQALLGKAKSICDYLILDSPPLLAVTDARILAGWADATIVVLEAGRTRTEAFEKACEALQQAKAKVIGVVMNKVKSGSSGYYYGYYGSSAVLPSAEATPEKNAGNGYSNGHSLEGGQALGNGKTPSQSEPLLRSRSSISDSQDQPEGRDRRT